MARIDISIEPFRSIYIAMTEIIEEAVAAQERGDVTAATELFESADILGKTMGILARAGSSASTAG